MISKAAIFLALLACASEAFLPSAPAQTAAFKTLSPFSAFSDGRTPSAALVKGNDGNYYGITPRGGAYGYSYEGASYGIGYGTFFRLTPAGEIAILHSFDGSDGLSPASLVKGSDGNFYGIADTLNYAGTIFKLTPAGVLTTLHNFSLRNAKGDNADGFNPIGLSQAADGKFYGVTQQGGSNGTGTVFQLTSGGVLTVLYNFGALVAGEDAGGYHPMASVIQGANGDLYGTAEYGGAKGCGTIFQLTATGVFTVLHNFTGGADGAYPASELVLGSDGNFYGSNLQGKIFQLTPAGSFTALHAMNISQGSISSLVQGKDGDLYGAISADTSGAGVIFKITTAGAYTALHNFAAASSDGSNEGGADPLAPLLLGSDGNFYGSASEGGAYGAGTLFKISPAGTLTVLHDFSAANAAGAEPASSLVLGANGNLYGTAQFGGAYGQGTAFEVTPAGTLSALYSFSSADNGGYAPKANLILGSSGDFYGTTFSGGANGLGTIFQLTPGGALSGVSLTSLGGSGLQFPLAPGPGDAFYGTTADSYSSFGPSVFKVTTAGALTYLYDFSGINLDVPSSGLTLGKDGNFYGSTLDAIYKITPAGVRTTLYAFNSGAGINADPTGGVIQARDGNFYGVTQRGGANGNGTVYRLTPAGVLTTLHSFGAFASPTGIEANRDGAGPLGLVQGSDGNFYGTANAGGVSAGGVVFQITPGGVLTNLHSFSALDASLGNSDGQRPTPGLVEAGPGRFYGTASFGGANGTGAIFELTVSPQITSPKQAAATENEGFTYQITATNGPVSFTAAGLPTGLKIGASGQITGKPSVAGVFSIGLSASNAGGSGVESLTLTVAPAE